MHPMKYSFFTSAPSSMLFEELHFPLTFDNFNVHVHFQYIVSNQHVDSLLQRTFMFGIALDFYPSTERQQIGIKAHF